MTSSKSALNALLRGGGAELVPNFFALLTDRGQAGDEWLPSTGISLAWERSFGPDGSPAVGGRHKV